MDLKAARRCRCPLSLSLTSYSLEQFISDLWASISLSRLKTVKQIPRSNSGLFFSKAFSGSTALGCGLDIYILKAPEVILWCSQGWETIIKQVSAFYCPRVKAGQPPVFIKLYWNTAMPVDLCISYSCFCATVVELSSCDRDPYNQKRFDSPCHRGRIQDLNSDRTRFKSWFCLLFTVWYGVSHWSLWTLVSSYVQ